MTRDQILQVLRGVVVAQKTIEPPTEMLLSEMANALAPKLNLRPGDYLVTLSPWEREKMYEHALTGEEAKRDPQWKALAEKLR